MADTSWRICTESIHGHEVDISVDEDGRFSARLLGSFFSARTLPVLRTELTKAARASIRVEVPFSALVQMDKDEAGEVVDLTGIGFNRGSWRDDLQLRFAVGQRKGKALRDEGYHRVVLLRRLSDVEKADLTKAHRALHTAEKKVNGLVDKFKVDGHAELRNALMSASSRLVDADVTAGAQA